MAFEKYGAKLLVRGGKSDAVEGKGRSRNIIMEFESLEVAQACYNSEQYQKAAAIRRVLADGEIILVEGLE